MGEYKCNKPSSRCPTCPYSYCIDGVSDDEALRTIEEYKQLKDIDILNNPDRHKVASQRWRERNRESERKRCKEYYWNNRERIKQKYRDKKAVNS